MDTKILKLTNGDEIITTLSTDDTDSAHTVIVNNPLKINTYPRMSKKGLEESMALSRWGSYGENDNCQLVKNSIVAITDASVGIAKFYEFCVLRMKNGKSKLLDISEPTKEQLEELEQEILEEYYDDDDPKTIH